APRPGAPGAADRRVPRAGEEGVVVARGAGRPARPRRLGVPEGSPERRELRGGKLSDQRRDREPAARARAASLPDLRARLEEPAQLVGREGMAARRLVVARGGELERCGIERWRLAAL